MTSGYSKGAVNRAGIFLRSHHVSATDELIEAFKAAHEWRTSHLQPMRLVRASISARARSLVPQSVSAGRLKRMKSIRKKLRNTHLDLTEIQDLGGCRAVLDNVAQCRELATIFSETTQHEIRRQTDYIDAPRTSGYRSHHLVIRYKGDDPSMHGRLLEVQIRTKLQHAWATSLEAVGLVRCEDLKGGEGSSDWLRFFALMAGEIADREDCPLPPGIPALSERRTELVDLNSRLDAVTTLDSYRRIIHATANIVSAGPGGMFLIEYDPHRQSVSVGSMASKAAEAYDRREAAAGRVDTVLVEVDRAADLRSAYPNYYLDVDEFLSLLRDAVHPPAVTAKRQQATGWRPDFTSWFRRSGARR